MELTAGTLTLLATPFPLEFEWATLSDTIVCSRYYSLFTFSWPRFESGSLHNGGMLILRG